MQHSWGKFDSYPLIAARTLGISVDTHIHRISNRLEWVSTKSPEETRIVRNISSNRIIKEIRVPLATRNVANGERDAGWVWTDRMLGH